MQGHGIYVELWDWSPAAEMASITEVYHNSRKRHDMIDRPLANQLSRCKEHPILRQSLTVIRWLNNSISLSPTQTEISCHYNKNPFAYLSLEDRYAVCERDRHTMIERCGSDFAAPATTLSPSFRHLQGTRLFFLEARSFPPRKSP